MKDDGKLQIWSIGAVLADKAKRQHDAEEMAQQTMHERSCIRRKLLNAADQRLLDAMFASCLCGMVDNPGDMDDCELADCKKAFEAGFRAGRLYGAGGPYNDDDESRRYGDK
jgi:hypothetical protein